MYTTCLFCNGDLGKNEAIETFPVGRRLAFDGTKGRLWVVCRRCERWNLTPLEERWEAIESCEREFRATRLRVSTGEIGLARLKEGLELVRIGAPQRPEMAAWRYGDQFGRRRRRHYSLIAGGAAVVGVAILAGPVLGIVGAGVVNPGWHLANAARSIYRSRKLIHVPDADAGPFMTRLADAARVRIALRDDELTLEVPVARLAGTRPGFPDIPWYRYDGRRETRELRGEAAVRAAGALLPSLNPGGGSPGEVQRAVQYLEEAATPEALFRRAALVLETNAKEYFLSPTRKRLLKSLPTAGRLALEMAAHEETERRALEGELHLLEEAWREAEEIAGIADDLLLPESVEAGLARLKGASRIGADREGDPR